MALTLSGVPLPFYSGLPNDLRVNVRASNLFFGDGTLGGAPISGINFGIPSTEVIALTQLPSGLVGHSLQAMMAEFPEYSRISSDESSLGAQLLGTVSRALDDYLEEIFAWNSKTSPLFYPTWEQGVLYEWDFGSSDDLETWPAVQARLGNIWFNLPLVREETLFWNSPPTRVEPTNCKLTTDLLLNWTQPSSNGLVLLLESRELPLHNYLYFNISGGNNFVNGPEDILEYGYIEIRGRWAGDNLRSESLRVERLSISNNGTLISAYPWQSIESIVVCGTDPGVYIRIRNFDFASRWRRDTRNHYFSTRRDQVPSSIFYQLAGDTTTFSSLVQTEESVVRTGNNTWLVKGRFNPDTISDSDPEMDIFDFWRLTKPDGSSLSAATIVDFVVIPDSPYLLLVDNTFQLWVVDTGIPALDFSGMPETTDSPVRIEMEYPRHSAETLANFSVRLNVRKVHPTVNIERYCWSVHHHGSHYLLNKNGSDGPVFSTSWTQLSTHGGDVPDLTYNVTSPGQYTFQLDTITEEGTTYRTFSAFRIPNKAALGAIPIRGMTGTLRAADFDCHGRLWLSDLSWSYRTVLRQDVAAWLVDEKILVTKEPYDEVRRLS